MFRYCCFISQIFIASINVVVQDKYSSNVENSHKHPIQPSTICFGVHSCATWFPIDASLMPTSGAPKCLLAWVVKFVHRKLSPDELCSRAQLSWALQFGNIELIDLFTYCTFEKCIIKLIVFLKYDFTLLISMDSIYHIYGYTDFLKIHIIIRKFRGQ